MFEGATTPIRTRRNYPTEVVARLGQALGESGGDLTVTSKYNHGYPAPRKNAMDHVFPEFNRKTVAFVGYGDVCGARAIELLRAICVEFEMAPPSRGAHPARTDAPGNVQRCLHA